jgi:tRNA pseudouridine55 synthase
MLDFTAGQTLLFDKPKGWTSFDLVKKVRGLIRVKKVGHAGTLDPLATGLLIVCTGKHTRQISTFQEMEKEYVVTFKLGATTPSYDSEFPEENLKEVSHISRERVETAMKSFLGPIMQTPPQYSAVKVDGQRAYKAARKGKEVRLAPRPVIIYEFEMLEFESPSSVKAKIRCSKGTYIRSLVRDLGEQLETGGYIRELVRTRIGEYRLEDAWDLKAFQKMILESRETED